MSILFLIVKSIPLSLFLLYSLYNIKIKLNSLPILYKRVVLSYVILNIVIALCLP